MAFNGIDVSYAQGSINWNQVKASWVQFAILRAGFGREVSQKDKKFEENYAACKAVGMPVGVYHYSYAQSVDEARVEARACLEWLRGKSLEYPVYYDLEDNSMQKLGRNLLTQIALAFCDEISKAGYQPGIYANKYWMTNLLDMAQLNQYPVWLAQYNSQITYTGKVDMWQYSSTGHVPGISGNVDVNTLYTVQTGWVKKDNKWYFYNGNGQLQKGWIKYKDRWYCTDEKGVMYAGTWKQLGGKWYLFDQDGKAHEGWYKSTDNKWYYLKPSTCDMARGWLEIDTRWYYFSPNKTALHKEGEMYVGKQTISNKAYEFATKSAGDVKEGQLISK